MRRTTSSFLALALVTGGCVSSVQAEGFRRYRNLDGQQFVVTIQEDGQSQTIQSRLAFNNGLVLSTAHMKHGFPESGYDGENSFGPVELHEEHAKLQDEIKAATESIALLNKSAQATDPAIAAQARERLAAQSHNLEQLKAFEELVAARINFQESGEQRDYHWHVHSKTAGKMWWNWTVIGQSMRGIIKWHHKGEKKARWYMFWGVDSIPVVDPEAEAGIVTAKSNHAGH